MARNVEIKARIASIEALLARARAIAGGAEPQRIVQDDSFFACARGRLKLRDFGNGRGELIQYERPDDEGPKTSSYLRSQTDDPAGLREVLTVALGSIGRVRKERWLLLAGRSRIHLDRVEGLGDHLEIEVVLAEGESEAVGTAEAEALLARLGIDRSQWLAGAYLDRLAPAAPTAASQRSSSAGTASARKS